MLEDQSQLDLLQSGKHKPVRVFDLGWTSAQGIIRFGIPIKLDNPKNQREHWREASGRTSDQRTAAWVHCNAAKQATLLKIKTSERVLVTITRFGPLLLDNDNLQFSASAIRDGVADALGRGDGPKSGIKWEYKQEITDRGYAVGVEIRCDKVQPVRKPG